MNKKLNQEIFKFFFKFCMMLGGLVFFIVYFDRFKINPLDRIQPVLPTYLALDSQDNIYFIDNTWRTVYKINKEGLILSTLKGGDKSSPLYEIWNIAIDEEDNLYLMNAVYDVESRVLEKEEIVKYKPDGSFEKSLFVLDYKDLKKQVYNEDYNIRAITTDKNDVFMLMKETENTGGIYKIGEKNRIEKLLSIQDPLLVNRIAVIENKIIISYTNNNILLYENKNKSHNLTQFFQEGAFLHGVTLQNSLYFCDNWQRQIRKFSFEEKKEKILLSKDILKNKGDDYKKIHFSYLSANRKSEKIVAFEAFSRSFINFDKRGNISFVIKEIIINQKEMVFNILVFLSLLFFLYFLGNILYSYIFVKYVSVIIKVIFLTVPVVIGSILYITSESYEELYTKLENELAGKIKLLTGSMSIYIDFADIEKIKSPNNYDQKKVNQIINQLQNKFKEIADISDFKSTSFISILVVRNEEIYCVADRYSGVFSPHIYPDGYYDRVFKEGKTKVGKYSNYDGNFFAVALPIKNKEGKIICALESAVYTDEYEEIKDKIKKNAIKNMLIFTLLFVLILNFVILLLIYPLKTIRNAMKEVENGNLGTRVDITRKDEIGDIGKSFNSMTTSLVEKEKIRNLMNKVVSKEIAEKLLKEGIKFEGERIEGTVLFVDIRGFTKMCENMEPEEVIEMLNQYFDKMSKVINQNYGIIDKYVGDEIMALYGIPLPIVGEDGKKIDAFYAVKTAIEIMKTCEEINKEREALNKKPIKIGIGINHGYFVAGNLGSEDRLNYTVIGDDVNLGARLCSNAPEMTILINETVYEKVKEHFTIEKLEPIYVKGKSTPIYVYKVMI